ncbi:MAG: hypothetical protein GY747_03200 [Planctomycetes bacterium]|nr:hypothetical protein [Planctomycetota bacterium]
MDQEVPGLRDFPRLDGLNVIMPATSGALWCWIRGEDCGDLLHHGRALIKQLRGTFSLTDVTDVTDAFRYGSGLDITGYEDGAENPEGDDAAKVALLAGKADGLNGSSFVALKK